MSATCPEHVEGYADYYAGGNWEIKAKVIFFDIDIPGQPPQPGNLCPEGEDYS